MEFRIKYYFSNAILTILDAECENKGNESKCRKKKRKGKCHRRWAQKNCRLTCGLCQPNTCKSLVDLISNQFRGILIHIEILLAFE